MSYRQDSIKRTKNIKFAISALIAGVFFYFASGFILSAGYGALSFVSLPIWKIEASFSDALATAGFLFQSKESLSMENDKLKAELDAKKSDIASLSALRHENNDLLAELGREVPAGASSTVAAVLSGPNLPPYEDLIIDAGTDMGISVGDRVIYKPNIVLGEIEEVYSHSSKVKLYSGSGVRTDILIPGDTSTHAVAEGYGGGNFSLSLPSSVYLYNGMQLLIPGSDIYILATIDYIKVDKVNSVEEALARYPVNIKNIRFVHVVKAPANEYLR